MTTPVLDNLAVTPTLAVSTRRLKTSYAGSALRVVRSSDSTESDIGFVSSGNLNVFALGSFVGVENLITYSEDFTNAAWTKSNTTVASGKTAPDDTTNAILMTENTTLSDHSVYRSLSLASAQYTISLYAKASSRRYLVVYFYQSSTVKAVMFDLQTGTTVGVMDATNLPDSYAIEYSEYGYYRLSVTATGAFIECGFQMSNSSSPALSATKLPQYTGDGASGLYIFGAQISTGSLKAYCKTTTATQTTTYNGTVRTLYDQSGNANNLTNATTAQLPTILTSGVFEKLNGKVAPLTNGTNQILATGAMSVAQPFSRLSTMQAVTLPVNSVFMDATTSTNNKLYTSAANELSMYAGSNLVVKSTIPTNDIVTLSEVYNGSSSTSYYNGVQGSTGNPGSSGLDGLVIGGMSGATSCANARFGDVFVFASALSSSDRTTIEEDMASYWSSNYPEVSATLSAAYSTRKIVHGYTGNSLQVRRASDSTTLDVGFLSNGDLNVFSLANFVGVDNLKTYSEQFDSSNWGKINCAIIADSALAPDGYFTADKIYGTGGTVSHYLSSGVTLTGNGGVSIYAKAAEWNVLSFSNGPNNWAHFQLSGAGATNFGTGWTNGSITYIGDGWYRCFVASTTQTVAWSNVYVFVSNIWPVSNASNPSGTASSGTNGLYIWGCQVHASTSLLDYCKTTTAVTSSGSGYVSKWYDQTGNARDLVQATAANQPLLITGGLIKRFNNKPALSFTSASSTYLSVTGFTVAQPWSRLSVWQMTDVANGTGRVFLDNSNSTLEATMLTPSTTAIGMSRGGTVSLSLSSSLSEGYSSTVLEIADGWSSNGVVNGGSAVMGYTGTDGCDGLVVGCKRDHTSYATGLCGEALVITGVIGDTDKTTLQTDQKSYWTTATGVTLSRRRPMITV